MPELDLTPFERAQVRLLDRIADALETLVDKANDVPIGTDTEAILGEPFPYEFIENPHGDRLAWWRTTEPVDTFYNSAGEGEKPIFDINAGRKFPKGALVKGYRKVLNGHEANGQYIVILEPYGAVIRRARVVFDSIVVE